MPLAILAPVAGRVRALADVDDPVFSAELVGPGLAVDPAHDAPARVIAPVAGVVAKLHAHAFVVQTPDGRGVLVHLGINTVQLGGEGFTLHVAEGDTVSACQVLVTWDPAAVEAGGRSAVCPVVALDAAPGTLVRVAQPGDTVDAGDAFVEWA
ncbi:PTS sugar transporter subunit IIA [Cellulomonas fimi]|uniref:PTS system, glucose subfamily, IIA subunit n=1 Tax=Cellulomonas fimi (strain ATCC 484 / DSM 20113 / JCM 1341 / CCUG 24087 / LMG 16345 / NBRC 15513 / NCIMB 8980 / NCTC 7547 / NRS-133) TaxID=590998 RepID=F4H5U5_CELFA|nr:PTS glucose transporter subunit IIA [Cellulomonas fimi]AEE45545.1 PTS system, glucose subfamily, IIA subunit [Cellulomonas fimi ATCC 484]NNH05943.1 PTS glucose transporter subunit IIA [Cellulomonas fimi]VEH29805.1 Glucose-specific phosphotransferase enzyme IIA component [Cellulomonas fimi]